MILLPARAFRTFDIVASSIPNLTEPMPRTNHELRVAGSLLAIASVLMVVVLALHGPIAPDLNDQLQDIAGRAAAWSAIHWIAAAALSMFAVTGIIVLTSHSRLTESWMTVTAWAVLPICAIWTVTTAVAEATVIANAAIYGSLESFAAWWAFSEGMGNGFAVLVLAVAVIATEEARRSEPVTPAWSAWAATGAGLASFAGWALGMWFGVSIGGPLWAASTILMCLWILWFGVGLVRFQIA